MVQEPLVTAWTAATIYAWAAGSAGKFATPVFAEGFMPGRQGDGAANCERRVGKCELLLRVSRINCLDEST
jgi:hypothetical protein